MQKHPPGAGGCFLGMLSPGHGARKLEGKSFYLDAVKSRPAAFLAEAISHLGGRIESFLNKDVSFVVTGSLEGLRSERFEVTRGGSDGMTGECHSSPRSTKPRESIMTSTRQQRPATGTPRPMVCGSRGKALLEKAIRNNERLQGNSVLANARSWGVKIVHVDDLLTHVQLLTAESSKARRRKTELKNSNKYPAVSRVIKAGALKSPYLKVEDSSRKYKALHMQSMTFPNLCYSGRFSPFEPPAPPQPERVKEQEQNKARQIIKSLSTSQDKPRSPLPRNPSLCRARKKNLGYCECCHEPFKDQDEHLQSAQHRGFVQDRSHYSLVDQLVADMEPGFAPCPAPESAATTLLRLETTPLLLQLSHSPSEMQTHSETEHAIQALLTQGSPSNTLDPDPSSSTPSVVPLSSHAQPLPPCPDTLSLLLLPPLPQPLSSCPDNHPPSPDTLCQSPNLAPYQTTPSPFPLPQHPMPASQPLLPASCTQP
ncbi:protein DBF4 homolog B [Oncorhynchus tshawytscha]|uniref:DBF4-type domain-containing protein n=1 Tax=Oncorhynchus tshawytscha TaxID=74940 RepID=A0A8C8IG05_ONCTS|nr:protein DBF4 homolog B [Oncorhynchus tshawytscha]